MRHARMSTDDKQRRWGEEEKERKREGERENVMKREKYSPITQT